MKAESWKQFRFSEVKLPLCREKHLGGKLPFLPNNFNPGDTYSSYIGLGWSWLNVKLQNWGMLATWTRIDPVLFGYWFVESKLTKTKDKKLMGEENFENAQVLLEESGPTSQKKSGIKFMMMLFLRFCWWWWWIDDDKSTVVVFELHLKELVQRDAMVPAYLNCWSPSQLWPVTSGHLIIIMMIVFMLLLFPIIWHLHKMLFFCVADDGSINWCWLGRCSLFTMIKMILMSVMLMINFTFMLQWRWRWWWNDLSRRMTQYVSKQAWLG